MSNQILPVVLAVGGMYLILRYGLPDVWNKIIGDINPIPPIEPPPPALTVSKDIVTNGETFEVSVIGLKPQTPAYYGWYDIGGGIIFEKQVAIGDLYGVRLPFKFTEQVLPTTQPGQYTIYYDQSPFGGYFVNHTIKVIAP